MIDFTDLESDYQNSQIEAILEGEQCNEDIQNNNKQ